VNKANFNTIVNCMAFVIMLFMAATGSIMRLALPPGSGRFSTLWGMNRHQWGDIHYWLAITLLSVVGVHLYLHWQWVIRTIRGRLPEKAVFRVVLTALVLLCLVTAAIAPYFSRIESSDFSNAPHRGQHRQTSSSQ
jgi:hypothetical protein